MDSHLFCSLFLLFILTVAPAGAGGGEAAPSGDRGAPDTAGEAAQEQDGVGPAASFFAPEGIAYDGTSLFVADTNINVIRRVTTDSGRVTTLAGSAASWGTADGRGAAARFSLPRALTSDGSSLFVADTGNNTIRMVAIATGEVSTLAGEGGERGTRDGKGAAARFGNPEGIAADGTSLFVADSFNHAIRRVAIATGEVTTLAGRPGLSGARDGPAAAASFCVPRGVATDGTNLFVADSLNNAIRRVAIASGAVTTLAGSAEGWGAADGAGGAARFSSPHGLVIVGKSLFVTDTNNHTIRRIALETGAVTTLAGSPGEAGAADGVAGGARFFAPHGITSDGTFLYVTDTGSDTIRRVEIASGAVTTLAGAKRRVRFVTPPP